VVKGPDGQRRRLRLAHFIRDNLDQLTVAIGACDAAKPKSVLAAP
jgi:hypothetical protein